MPDCELPRCQILAFRLSQLNLAHKRARRSAGPNCEVVTLEDGTGAVVSLRSIAEGEFFSVGFSDAEDDSSDYDESDVVPDNDDEGH